MRKNWKILKILKVKYQLQYKSDFCGILNNSPNKNNIKDNIFLFERVHPRFIFWGIWDCQPIPLEHLELNKYSSDIFCPKKKKKDDIKTITTNKNGDILSFHAIYKYF